MAENPPIQPVNTPPKPLGSFTRLGIWAAGGVVIAVLFAVVKFSPMGLQLKPDIWNSLASVFGTLTLVSLFVERAIEVFVSLWTDPAADQLEQELDALGEARARQQRRIEVLQAEKADPGTVPDRKIAVDGEIGALRVKLAKDQDRDDEIDLELLAYSGQTRRVSTWIGLAIGVLTAAVGVRVLNPLVVLDFAKVPDGFGWFPACFASVDVLLTGALLSGGSKAVHHIFNVYETFMEATTKRAETAKATAAK